MNVDIFTTQTCPYCIATKKLLTQQGFSYTEHDVSTDSSLRKKIMKKTGRRTVPQIFMADRHIGGFDDLQQHLNVH